MDVVVRISISAQTSWPRSKLGRKVFIQLRPPNYCSSLKEVRTGTRAGQEAEPDAEAMEGCFLLACFPWLAQLAFLQNPGPSGQDGTTDHGLGPPQLTTNWENASQLDLKEAFPQLKLLSLWQLQPVSSWHTKSASTVATAVSISPV